MQHFNNVDAQLFEPIAPTGNTLRIPVFFFVQNLQLATDQFKKTNNRDPVQNETSTPEKLLKVGSSVPYKKYIYWLNT